MDARTETHVESWDARPFTDGYGDLHALAAEEFSGAVHGDGTWLFMLNGRVVGVFDGPLEAFEAASGTAYEAPHPGLPLLFAMREHGGTTQAKYYTNDTSLSEADDLLSEANFTGYVELSENVMSGDYYVVYYGGRSMNVAFVGVSEELKTGDEAFRLADDEVGIYEVKNVDIDIVDIPDVDEKDASEPSAAPQSAPAPERDPDAPESTGDPEPDAGDTGSTEPTDEEQIPVEEAEPNPAPDAEPAGAGDAEPSPAPGAESNASPAAGPTDATTGDDGQPITDRNPSTANAAGTDESRQSPPSAEADGEAPAEGTTPQDDVFSEEERWRQTKSIPALDPEKSESLARQEVESSSGQNQQSNPAAGTDKRPRASDARSTEPAAQESSGRREDARQADRRPADGEDVTAELEQRIEQVRRLKERLDATAAERDELRSEVERLEDRVTSLRTQLSNAGGDVAAAGGPDLSPEEALTDTNLFVRYGSRSNPTLEDARDSEADRAEVNKNLRLEHHTQFEAGDATVDGRPFEEFLTGTVEYQFVTWVVEELLYEIRETGHRSGLQELFQAIPEIDRAQLRGSVEVETGDATDRRSFDVVLRDRMGAPLLVADLSTSRDPVSGDMMEALIESATDGAEASEELSAAFFVTVSFFEPDALEAASGATGGGFLSRDKRESFVRVGRKEGYHLCLVEARNGSFHVNVPEL